jgi:hypothetical protein
MAIIQMLICVMCFLIYFNLLSFYYAIPLVNKTLRKIYQLKLIILDTTYALQYIQSRCKALDSARYDLFCSLRECVWQKYPVA